MFHIQILTSDAKMVLSSEYSAPVSNKGHGDVSDTQDGTNKTKTENKSLPDHRYEVTITASNNNSISWYASSYQGKVI